jgi:DNA-binding PadR family transcriptional regulator
MSHRSRTPYTILGCLTIEPMSGYAIKQFLEQTVSHFWSESYGQIYPALRKLEEEGLIEGQAEPGGRGQDRRVYRIADAGRERLREWLREPAQPVQGRYEHSLKLFFGHHVGPDVSLEHLGRLRRQTEEDLAHYRSREKDLMEWAAREPEGRAAYWLVVLRGGIRYSEMVLGWCAESAKTLRDLRRPDASDRPRNPPSMRKEHDG